MVNGEIEDSLQATVKEVNAGLESHERIAQVLVSDTPWSIENGLLTPTLKLKRVAIENAYNDAFSENQQQVVVWQ